MILRSAIRIEALLWERWKCTHLNSSKYLLRRTTRTLQKGSDCGYQLRDTLRDVEAKQTGIDRYDSYTRQGLVVFSENCRDSGE